MESANPDLKHPQAAFAEPLPYGYVYVGMTVDPPGRAPFVRLRCPAPCCPYSPECVEGEFFGVLTILIQFTSNSHLDPLHCAPEPIKHKELMKCTKTL
jgi:hypothetical protein